MSEILKEMLYSPQTLSTSKSKDPFMCHGDLWDRVNGDSQPGTDISPVVSDNGYQSPAQHPGSEASSKSPQVPAAMALDTFHSPELQSNTKSLIRSEALI